MQYTLSLFFIAVISLSCISSSNSNDSGDKPSNQDTQLSNIEDTMLKSVNEYRRSGCKCGRKRMKAVPPLTWNDKLEKAALQHARDMAANGFFSHKGSDKSIVSTRSSAQGYQWRYIGENIAKGPSTVREVVDGWQNSPSHCENMMDPNYRDMGAAKVGDVWVQVFGQR